MGFVPLFLHNALAKSPGCKPLSGGRHVPSIPYDPVCAAVVAVYIGLALMSHFERPQRLLCLSCATLLDPTEIADEHCSVCGEAIDVEELVKLYEYAAETHY